MKYIKITGFLFVLAVVFSLLEVQAVSYGYKAYSQVTLPSFKGIAEKGPVGKQEANAQHYTSGYTYSSIGTSIDSQVRLKDYINDATSSWVTLGQTDTATFSGSSWAVQGAYYINFRTKDTKLTNSTHGGEWFLDGSYYNK